MVCDLCSAILLLSRSMPETRRPVSPPHDLSGRRLGDGRGNYSETLIVMLSLPFALVGGLLADDFNMSVAVAVGFIALAGVAAETGVVMLIYLEHAWRDQRALAWGAGRMPSREDLYRAIMIGAVERVRPKMMTVVAIMAGLLPIMWTHGTGSEVMSRIAAPMVGGMISSTV